MKITFLGTGTSQGVPVIGCNCKVCTSTDPKNFRLRPSVLIETENENILIDASNEFRLQMLKTKTVRLDAILLTHFHFDHISGLNDLREYNWVQKSPMNIYGNSQTIEEVKITFRYAFMEGVQKGGGLPKLNLNIIGDRNIFINKTEIIPIPILHGNLDILGFRINDFAYITDASTIPEDSFPKLANLEVLILNTLRHRPHPTHFNVEQSVEVTRRINPKKAYYTHICHDLDHDEVNKTLPEGIELAYDGLIVDC